jgi:hypothetical protein
MEAKYLKTGDKFKIGKARNFREVKFITEITDKIGPKKHVGKLLIVDDSCRQLLLSKDDEVQIREFSTLSEMKVFELVWSNGEKEWVCAHTNIEALKTYMSITGTDEVDMDNDDELREIPKWQWRELFIELEEDDEDYDQEEYVEGREGKKTISFETYMKHAHKPDIMAGTMYD